MSCVNEKLSVRRAIEFTDGIYPNTFSFCMKALWLRELDMRLIRECLSRYEGTASFSGEDYSSSPEAVLVAPYEFLRLYASFLAMQFDIVNGDVERYENSSRLFNNYLMEYMTHINRTHKALKVRINIE